MLPTASPHTITPGCTPFILQKHQQSKKEVKLHNAKVTTFTGADLAVELEVDGDGTLIDDANTVTEFVDAPVKLNERGLRQTSTSRATSSATNTPHSAELASQYSYHNLLTYVGTEERHGKRKICDVGTVEQKHGTSKSSDVVRMIQVQLWNQR